MAALLAAALAFGLAGCKPTDFFTEIIISPFAEEVDEDNATRTVINSPDADEESDVLSALSWTDDSDQSQEVENLVVYSSSPTSDLLTRHSIFNLYPLLSSVEASDGVRVLYAASAELESANDGSVEESQDEELDEELEETSVGGEGSQDAEETLQEAEAGDATASEEADATDDEAAASPDDDEEGDAAAGDSADEAGDDSGTQAGGDEDSNVSGEAGGTEGDGDDDDPYAGYDGAVTVYDAGNALATLPEVETLAVIGADVAVLVQAIGGDGAICAMSVDAYYGTDEDTTASSFRTVFGELAGDFDTEEFEASKLLWENDGSDPDDLVSVEALIAACGEGGVIVYDQTMGDQYSFFSDEQRKELYAAGITLVPVDLSTVQGILDAAAAIGDLLANSSICANDASAMAQAYIDAVDSIVSGVADTHGGTIAALTKDGAYSLLTEYQSCPVTTASVVGGLTFPIECYIATDAATGWSWLGSGDIDASGIVLFQNNDYESSPLAFWGQVAGVAPGSSSSSTASTELLWPYTFLSPVEALFGTGTTYNRWLSSGSSYSTMQAGPASQSEGYNIPETYGLGSKYVPYLIVCATEDLTADEVRALVVESLGSYGTSGVASVYSAFPYYTGIGEGSGTVPMSSSGLRSTIGAQNADSGTYESPFYTSLHTDSVVRANPCGLLGSWTEGTMESVLEAVWLADLYSRSPDGCAYEAINDMSLYSAQVGEYTCTTTQETVVAFYRTFYRLSAEDAQACYDAAVTDQLDDL